MKRYLIVLVLLFIPVRVFALNFPSVESKYVEIYDKTDDKVIYEKDSNKKVSIASLTKIATTITAIEMIKDLDQEVTISDNILSTVRWDASTAGLKSGDRLTYKDLLYASMLPSGADATNTIAITSSGSIENFVKKMNNLVNKLGLINTHFEKVTGLDDENHYSTVDDVRKLLNYALDNELFRTIYTTKVYTLSNGLTVKSTLDTYTKNSNSDVSKILGSKSGFTQDAGLCLSSLINKSGHDIIVLTLNAPVNQNIYYNVIDSVKLINFIDKNYNNQLLINKDKIIKTIGVDLANIDSYDIKVNDDIYMFLPNDYNIDLFRKEYSGVGKISYKNKFNEKIGTIKYYYNGQLIKEDDVLIDVELKFNLLKYIKKNILIIICICILILIVSIYIIIKKRK